MSKCQYQHVLQEIQVWQQKAESFSKAIGDNARQIALESSKWVWGGPSVMS
jgi:hypothetical protein